jgi:hypothetical protein
VIPIDPDEVIIATPAKTITWEGDEPIRVAFWTLWRRVRRRYVLRALPLRDLIELENELKIAGPLGIPACVATIAGEGAARAPYAVQQAIYDAHFEVNYPKATAAAESRSAEEPSSAASAPGMATASSTPSA